MSDVPGQQPMFEGELPKPSGITPPALNAAAKREASAAAKRANMGIVRPKRKKTITCPHCGKVI